MREQIRSRIADGLDRIRLLGPVERVREGFLSSVARRSSLDAASNLPLPPPRLRLLVDGRSADGELFLAVGKQLCDSIQAAVAASDTAVGEMEAVLDFGCGCGRVARHWTEVAGPEIHGCDYNPELVAWCTANLRHLRSTRNELAPPTSYESGSFDLIYALSVFSHLDEPLQQAWLEEYRRLLRPGGLLVLSLLGEKLCHRLAAQERSRFDRGEMVVRRPRMAGSNLCTVYHPHAYVTERLLVDFDDVCRFELGSAAVPIYQDGYVARRR